MLLLLFLGLLAFLTAISMLTLFGTLFTIPDATTTLSDVGAWSGPLFTDLWPLVMMIGGIALALGIAFSIIRAIKH